MNNIPISIREVDKDDVLLYIRLFQEYRNPMEVDRKISKVVFQRFLKNEDHRCYFAIYQGQVVGFIILMFHYNAWLVNKVCHLEDMYVKPDFQRNGVGTSLINHAESIAKKLGCGHMWWVTSDSNAPAMNLYEKTGQRNDYVWFQKDLA